VNRAVQTPVTLTYETMGAEPIAELIVVRGTQPGTRFALGKTEFIIGRGATAALRIAESGVAAEHCAVRPAAGGYRLVDRRSDAPDLDARYTVQIVASGAMIPEAVTAAKLLHQEGVAANVINVTSPGLLYHGLAEARRSHLRQGTTGSEAGHLGELILPEERRAPIVTVQDGASHALSFLGSAFGARVVPLGVDEFGQSGTRADLYQYYAIDSESIVSAALLALDIT
jgi:pyruvate dehydrogenase complex dehydrogenase (E1) component